MIFGNVSAATQGKALLHTAEGKPVDSGPNAWLFVLRDQTIFATDKKTDPPRFVRVFGHDGFGIWER